MSRPSSAPSGHLLLEGEGGDEDLSRIFVDDQFSVAPLPPLFVDATLFDGGAVTCATPAFASIVTRCGVTGAPGRTCCKPLTTITSPAARPWLTTRSPSMFAPRFT